MVFSFWNAAGRVELAASTSAKRVKSGGEGRAPANGSAIRGMPGSEFEPRLFCCAEREKKETPSVRMVFSFWNAAGRMELAASTSAKRGEPFRRGRRPRRPVSAAVPRWERIPTSLRAAKQVPLGAPRNDRGGVYRHAATIRQDGVSFLTVPGETPASGRAVPPAPRRSAPAGRPGRR